MKPLPFTTSHESITVIYEGKSHTIHRSQAQFVNLKRAIEAGNWDEVPNHLTIARSLKTWAKGKFTVNEETEVFSYEGKDLPSEINKRIIAMASAGENPGPLLKFYERLKKNPSYRSVHQLYQFLTHSGIPITTDGCFLAYKGVRQDYQDVHSGQFSNKPGVTNKMPRNEISDDPEKPCHEGFHVGALRYARSFGTRVVVCKIDPENVVCVPYDSSQEKMRVCEYKVIGNHGEKLPDTVHEEEDFEQDPDDDDEVFNTGGAAPLHGKTPAAIDPKDVPSKYRKLAYKAPDELMAQSLDNLRKLATYGLNIVGASKIPGGKASLISTIIDVRDGNSRKKE